MSLLIYKFYSVNLKSAVHILRSISIVPATWYLLEMFKGIVLSHRPFFYFENPVSVFAQASGITGQNEAEIKS